MKTTCARLAAWRLLLLGIAAVLAAPWWAQGAEPELGVARISLTNGDVSIRRGESGDWIEGKVNMPLVEGDAIATGRGSRAEVQLDYSNFIRLDERTEVEMATLGNRRFRVQVAYGVVTYSELKGGEADVDIETPHVAVRPMERGRYRVEVASAGETRVTVRKGVANVASPEGIEKLARGRTMIVREDEEGTKFQIAGARPEDAWDEWNEDRDGRLKKIPSRRYVSEDVYGVEDLDRHGQWRYVSGYGYSWFPAAPGFVPYRHGRWIWVDHYGWTWHSHYAWGWAPFHFGRWFHHPHLGWAWYPGHRHHHHIWRPALVAFFGFGHGNFSLGLGFGHVGWVPLGPHDPFYPWWGRHRRHGFIRGGGVHHNTILVDNSVNIFTKFRNARAPNGVTVLNAQRFSTGRINSPRSLRRAELNRASLIRGQIPVVPARESLGRRTSVRSLRASAGSQGRRFGAQRGVDSRAVLAAARAHRAVGPFLWRTQRPARHGSGRAWFGPRRKQRPAGLGPQRRGKRPDSGQRPPERRAVVKRGAQPGLREPGLDRLSPQLRLIGAGGRQSGRRAGVAAHGRQLAAVGLGPELKPRRSAFFTGIRCKPGGPLRQRATRVPPRIGKLLRRIGVARRSQRIGFSATAWPSADRESA